LARKGFLVMRFDFSGTNISDGRFEDKLMSQEVADIKNAIDYLCKNYSFSRLVLHGHSTGAIDAALYAYKDKRIAKLILSGAIDRLDSAAHFDFSDMQVRDFWTKGYIKYKSPHSWVNNKRLNKDFYDEYFKLDLPGAIHKYRRPLCIIHGEKDEGIPVERASDLYRIANRPKKIHIIKGADHRFSNRIWLESFVELAARFAKGYR
jgi:uncharacterized protein